MEVTGTYKQKNAVEYERYLKELNVGYVQRKSLTDGEMRVTITESASHVLSILTRIGQVVQDITFELNKPFDEATMDGRQCQSTITKINEYTLLKKQMSRTAGEKDTSVMYVCSDDSLVLEMTCDNVTAHLYFTKV